MKSVLTNEEVKELRLDFPMFKNHPDLIYFDNAATTFKPYQVIEEVNNYYQKYSVNVFRGDYSLASNVDRLFHQTREKIASFINAPEVDCCVITHGASESLNMVAYGYGEFVDQDDVILTLESEHASSILPWMSVAKQKQAIVDYIHLDQNFRIDFDRFEKQLLSDVKVIVLAHVSNVLAYINDVKRVCEMAHRKGIIVVVDAAQSIAHLPIDVQELDVDFLAFSAHKMLGSNGVGVLYGKRELLEKIEPMLRGGGSSSRFDSCGSIEYKSIPYKFESGTPNIEGVLAFAKAIDYLTKIGMDRIHEYECRLKDYCVEKLSQLENIFIYNPDANSGIITFNVKDIYAQDVTTYLSNHNIAARSGQHCAKLLMKSLKTFATVRISFYFYNTFEEIDRFIEVIKNISLEKCLEGFF